MLYCYATAPQIALPAGPATASGMSAHQLPARARGPKLATRLKRLLAIGGLVLAAAGGARAQAYTYTVGEAQLRPTQDVTLRAGESLHIPTNTVYTGQVTFEGTGQLIVNDWVWIAATVALPAQATLTNRYMLSLEQLTLASGATVHNAHQCATTALVLAAGAVVQNDADGWMQVYSEGFANAGLIRNCGTFLAQSWAAGGKIVGCAPLPVQLVSFTAEPAAGGVALRWRTAQEVNAARYEVEHSPDGQVFAPLSQQPAKGASTYAATDKARPGTQYYRLRIVDADASFRYSPVAVVSGGATLVSRAWYNEVGQRLGAPRPGFLLEVSTYANGAVASRKYWQQ
ncbi:hypothetical protein [Hymenobacter nivis]|uniref:F5/8 type C domain-containing protein n=1 Tax=Hymenobacter nivis TaxID=1850093 RepID=A0A502GUB9_9BACT|nr:hypothetical protein [Hymenobacter nivis]TPG65819.1 hypothetical protein EAH73_10510 [Hymenobacter nivis]